MAFRLGFLSPLIDAGQYPGKSGRNVDRGVYVDES